MKVKVIKKDQQKETRIRPEVKRKLLLDQKSRILIRVREIDRELQMLKVETA